MRDGVITTLLPWVLSPLLGALIGYVTNALAIRMLFRPLKAIRVFGIRLPLTPGVIPKQRDVLADSIGQMVSERLITEDALERQIAASEFQEGLQKNVTELTQRLFASPLSDLSRDTLPVLYSSIQSFISELLFTFMSSRSFIYAVRNVTERLIRSVADMRIEELFGREETASFIERRIFPNILDGRVRKWLNDGLQGWMQRHLQRNTPLSEIVPEELVNTGVGAMETLLPDLLASLLNWLRSDETKRDLEARARILLKDILDKLNIVQKFFVSVTQYDTTLDEKMPEIIAEALDSLENTLSDPDVRQNIVETLRSSLGGWREKGISDVVYNSRFKVDEGIESLVNHLFHYLERPETPRRIQIAASRFLERQQNRTVRSVLATVFGITENEIVEFASSKLLTFLSKHETPDALSAQIVTMAGDFLEDRGSVAVGELLKIDRSKKEKLDSYLANNFSRLLKERLPYLVESLNIKQLVVEKINELDVAQVESLLLMVIAKHLKWINAFGALLGALIGFSQVVLRLLQIV